MKSGTESCEEEISLDDWLLRNQNIKDFKDKSNLVKTVILWIVYNIFGIVHLMNSNLDPSHYVEVLNITYNITGFDDVLKERPCTRGELI